MNKKFTAYFTERGLTVNNNHAYGVFGKRESGVSEGKLVEQPEERVSLGGFETNVEYRLFDNVAPLYLHFSCYTTDEQKRAIQQALNAASIKFCKFAFSAFGLEIGLNDITAGRLLKRLDEVLDKICSVLTENGALGVGYCPVCGKPLDFENSKKCAVNGITISIDNDCVANINNLITAENKEFDEAPNNYGRGFLGAFLGGLVGVAIAVGLYFAGFISAISAFVSILLGEFLYRKLGGKPNKIMVVILSVTTFVMMMLTIVGIYFVVAAIEGAEYGYGPAQSFLIVMQNEEVQGYFIRELLLTVLFSALGCGYEIFMMIKRVKRKSNI